MKAVVLLAAALTMSETVQAQWVEVDAQAYEPGTESLLYTEHHEILLENGMALRHRVSYRDPQGQPLAEKQVDYSASAFAPEFEMRMPGTGYLEGARRDGDRYLLYRQEPGEDVKEKAIRQPPNLVTDAGFDNFVRSNMERIVAGEVIEFRLATAGALRGYDFRARLVDQSTFDGQPMLLIRVEPDSLLRWVVAPLVLMYTRQPVALRVYEGRTNIPDGQGGRFDARLRFGVAQPIEPPAWSLP